MLGSCITAVEHTIFIPSPPLIKQSLLRRSLLYLISRYVFLVYSLDFSRFQGLQDFFPQTTQILFYIVNVKIVGVIVLVNTVPLQLFFIVFRFSFLARELQ